MSRDRQNPWADAAARAPSPAARMLARHLTRPRALARMLVLGEALAERPRMPRPAVAPRPPQDPEQDPEQGPEPSPTPES